MVRMNRGPANALSLELCAELSEALRAIGKASPGRPAAGKTTTAVVLASSVRGIFSAGLDIAGELYEPDPARLPSFWWHVQQLFLDVYGRTDLSIVAALGGHAPAAGCMLALSCDYRVMVSEGAAPGRPPAIGLNESRLGIVAPPWMAKQYTDVLGHRRGELALLEGTLFPPNAALDHGLVDELVPPLPPGGSGESDWGTAPEEAALAKARELVAIPQGARAAVKELTRTPLVEDLLANREEDTEHFCRFVSSDPVQRKIGAYLEALKQKQQGGR